MYYQKKEKVNRIVTQNQRVTNEYPLKSRLFAISTIMGDFTGREKTEELLPEACLIA